MGAIYNVITAADVKREDTSMWAHAILHECDVTSTGRQKEEGGKANVSTMLLFTFNEKLF